MEFKPHHVAISVKDIKTSKQFYEIFGFREVFSYSDRDMSILQLKLGNFILEIFSFKDEKQRGNLPLWEELKITGVKHFALQVQDINEALKFLQEKGIISGNTKINTGKSGIKYFFIQDPDGIYVEIVEDKRTFLGETNEKKP